MQSTDKKTDKNQPLLLIVDDEPGVRQSLQLVFNKTYRTIEAASAEDAIQKATEENPDLVLLDIMMPGMDGFETCRRLKRDAGFSNVPVIFMTGLAETEHIVARDDRITLEVSPKTTLATRAGELVVGAREVIHANRFVAGGKESLPCDGEQLHLHARSGQLVFFDLFLVAAHPRHEGEGSTDAHCRVGVGERF